MALERLTQITQVGIQSGITLQNINVEGANVSGVVTATTLSVAEGFNVTGVVTATTFVGNVTGNINPSSLVVTGVSTFQASSHWGDGDVAYFGDDDDLLIFHNSTDSIIRDTGTGDLYIEGGNVIRMTNPTGIETYATFNQDAAVELYYDGNKKFETTSGGAKVSGDLVVSGIITSGTSTITIDGPNNSITVGDSFIKNNAVGLGSTNTTGRNAGVGTAVGTIIFNTTTNSLQYYTGSLWNTIQNSFSATGGTVSYAGGKTIHTFTSSGTFTFEVNLGSTEVEYLVVAGGGGGGHGGGGAGGFRTGSGFPVTPGSYTVTVGAGGNGGISPSRGPVPAGSQGSDSIFSTITSVGGGGGAAAGGTNATNGGSGGGQGGDQPTATRTTGTPGQGFGGGRSDRAGYGAGGGGGGSSQAGSDSTPESPVIGNGGPGGNGTASSISGTSVTYAGGGGGGSNTNSTSATGGGLGGSGGGGNGGRAADTGGNPGTVNTGGGGGGAEYEGSIPGGGNGGSGIVIIAYPS